MDPNELYWLKVSALGQVAGAAATFLAVVVSLVVAFSGRRPKIKLKVGERLIIGGFADDQVRVLMFSVANAGQRPTHIRGIGWRTGWLPWGPEWLRFQHAVQMTGNVAFGQDPPYELQEGAEISSYALMDNVLDNTRKRSGKPFFSRIWPIIGRKQTRIQGYVYTADGYRFRVNAEPSLAKSLADAEIIPVDA